MLKQNFRFTKSHNFVKLKNSIYIVVIYIITYKLLFFIIIIFI